MEMKKTEARLQAEAVEWFRKEFPQWRTLLIMIKNDGDKNPVQASKDLALGLQSGTPDLFLAIPNRKKKSAGLWLEIKTEDGAVSSPQMYQMGKLSELGYKTVVCWSVDQFRAEVIDYLT